MTVTADRVGTGTYHMYGLTNELVGPAIASTLHATNRLFDTGVNASHRVLAPGSSDPHYTITSVPSGEPFTTPGPAVVQSNHSAWLANSPVGSVGSSFTSTVPVGTTSIRGGTYVTETTFDLLGYTPTTAFIHGRVAVDNNLDDVVLNGTSLGISAGGFAGWSNFEIPVGSPFLGRQNTLELVWRNAGDGAGGLRAEFDLFAEYHRGAAIPGLFNTGVDGNGIELPAGSVDPHYEIIELGGTLGVHDAYAVNRNGAWVDDGAGAQYISSASDRQGPGGITTYRTTFDLTEFFPDTAEVTGYWATDNAGVEILLNDQVVFTGNDEFYGLWQFHIPTGSPFVRGINTLDFRVNNAGAGDMGLLVTGLVGTAALVPEPSTLALAALGVLGLAFWRRRRR